MLYQPLNIAIRDNHMLTAADYVIEVRATISPRYAHTRHEHTYVYCHCHCHKPRAQAATSDWIQRNASVKRGRPPCLVNRKGPVLGRTRAVTLRLQRF